MQNSPLIVFENSPGGIALAFETRKGLNAEAGGMDGNTAIKKAGANDQ